MNVYCEKCNDCFNPKLKAIKREFEVRGKKYEYMGYDGYCPNCGDLIAPVNDEDIKARDRAYRKEEGIITVDQIIQVMSKYNVGKKPLAKLLGWGENTIVRYILGDIPSKIYSDELLKLLNDESYMLEILEKNKENITAICAEKIRKTIINNNDTSSTEIDRVASYLIYKGGDLTPLTLQKLLYYSQGFYSAFFDNYLFEDECQAWIHGPVYNHIYEKYKSFKRNVIVEDIEYNFSKYLDSSKIEFLDIIIKCFGLYSGVALEKMTHYEQPWIIARNGSETNEPGDNIINKEDMKLYFKEVKKSMNMINIFDIKKYSKDMFEKIQTI